MVHILCENRIHWDDLLVLSEPFGCNSALEKGDCSCIDQKNQRNTIHDENLQSLSSALQACCWAVC